MRPACKIVFASLLVFAMHSSAQVPLASIRSAYKNFDYEQVITLSERALENKEQLTAAQVVEILQMKAIAHYSRQDLTSALFAFQEILRIDPEFQLDPVKTSPKIIQFFDEIKKSMPQPVSAEPVRIDTVKFFIERNYKIKWALGRSMLMPGWGHRYINNTSKGTALSAIGLAALASALYFTIDCQRNEKAYLSETDKQLIDEKYSKYNTAYKFRNTFIASYALTWLFSQVDLLVFQKDDSERPIKSTGLQMTPTSDKGFLFSCRFDF